MVIKSPEKDRVNVYAPDSSWNYFADVHGNQITNVKFLNLIMEFKKYLLSFKNVWCYDNLLYLIVNLFYY